MGTLKVDKIVSTTGDATSAPITLSGDTATLGTGATIGSGVTFPAGHVLNVISLSINGDTTSYSGSSTTDWHDTNGTITLTSSQYSGGSKIYVMAQIGIAFNNWTAGKFRLYRTLPSTAVQIGFISSNAMGQGNAPSAAYGWGRSSSFITGIDTITAGGADHVYKVQWQWVVGNNYYNNSGTDPLRITAMVIK